MLFDKECISLNYIISLNIFGLRPLFFFNLDSVSSSFFSYFFKILKKPSIKVLFLLSKLSRFDELINLSKVN